MYFELKNSMQFVDLNLTSRNTYGAMSICIRFAWNGIWSLQATLCTTMFMHSNGSQNKEQLYPYTILSDWFL